MSKVFSMVTGCLLILQARSQQQTDTIPLGGNAWRHKMHAPTLIGDSTGGFIDNDGVGGWSDSTVYFDVWFRTSAPGDIRVWIIAKVQEGESLIEVIGGDPARRS